jgi:hypothetical protein
LLLDALSALRLDALLALLSGGLSAVNVLELDAITSAIDVLELAAITSAIDVLELDAITSAVDVLELAAITSAIDVLELDAISASAVGVLEFSELISQTLILWDNIRGDKENYMYVYDTK